MLWITIRIGQVEIKIISGEKYRLQKELTCDGELWPVELNIFAGLVDEVMPGAGAAINSSWRTA